MVNTIGAFEATVRSLDSGKPVDLRAMASSVPVMRAG
jgi:hypothetical protein